MNLDLFPEYKTSTDRFIGTEQLFGSSYASIRAAHIAVIGLGGVGCWAAEALVRSGVERITLIDPDEVCINNSNRQLQADSTSVGKAKVETLALRFKQINPDCQVTVVQEYLDESNVSELVSDSFDGVIDAIDSVLSKVVLIKECKKKNIPLVVCGAAGGIKNPSLVRTVDLNQTCNDALLAKMRKILRQKHSWPRGTEEFGVLSVSSSEKQQFASSQYCDPSIATGPIKATCENGLGSVCFVTGAFGFQAAAAMVELMVRPK